MITNLRRYLETWPMRVLFGILAIAFVVWGVGDIVNVAFHKTWLAKAAGVAIQPQQFQANFQRQMAAARERLPKGQDLTQAQRTQVAHATLNQMVGNIAVSDEEQRLRIAVPDKAIQEAVFAMPAFHDKDGKFDRSLLDAILRRNQMTEGEFLSLIRGDLARQQIFEAVTAGAVPSRALVKSIFEAENEQRSASYIELPFAAAPAPPAPTEAQLHRWYDNHPKAFAVPEYRRVRIVVLSPETIAKSTTVSDADLHAWYDSHKSQFVNPPTRSLDVAILPDQAKAKALAGKWKGGDTWAVVQKAAEAAGGSATTLDKATEVSVPDDALAKAAFAAKPDQVAGPVKVALGWAVLRVTAAAPGSEKTFDHAKAEVRKRIVADRASAALYDDANKTDNLLGTGAGLDHLPPDLGLAGATGTLDAEGNTPEGKPAPIPGPKELRKAVAAAAFAAAPGPPSQLTEVQTPSTGGSAFYAVQVEKIIPASRKPFEKVADQVKARWIGDARVHEQEVAAAAMLTTVQKGESLPDAAAKAGLTVRTTPLVTRDDANPAMPAQLRKVLFGLKPNEPTMVQTEDGFLVAKPDKTVVPTPKDKPEQYQEVEKELTNAAGAGVATIFLDALRVRANVQINKPVFDSFAQP